MSVKSAAQPRRASSQTATRDQRSGGQAIDEAVEEIARAASALSDAANQLQRLLADRATHGEAVAGTLERAGKLFTAEVRALLGDAPLDDDAVRRAARQTVAEQAWERRLGTLLDTADVVALLGVTRQQISALSKAHRLIALKHDGRHRFPAWQFAATDARQRACLAAAHRQLVDAGGLSPWTAASWFVAAHPELDELDPVSFLRAGGDCNRLLLVSGRDAARAAQ